MLDDGAFELLLIPAPKTILDMQALGRSLLLQEYDGPGLIFRHVSNIRIESDEVFPWSLDGEFDPGAAAVDIQNLHQRLEFLL